MHEVRGDQRGRRGEGGTGRYQEGGEEKREGEHEELGWWGVERSV